MLTFRRIETIYHMAMEHVTFHPHNITNTRSHIVGFETMKNNRGNVNAIICMTFNAYNPINF